LALTVSKTGSLVCGEKYRFAFLLSVNERLRVFQDGEKYRLPHIFQLEGSRIRFDDYPSRLIDIVHYICCDFELHLFPLLAVTFAHLSTVHLPRRHKRAVLLNWDQFWVYAGTVDVNDRESLLPVS